MEYFKNNFDGSLDEMWIQTKCGKTTLYFAEGVNAFLIELEDEKNTDATDDSEGKNGVFVIFHEDTYLVSKRADQMIFDGCLADKKGSIFRFTASDVAGKTSNICLTGANGDDRKILGMNFDKNGHFSSFDVFDTDQEGKTALIANIDKKGHILMNPEAARVHGELFWESTSYVLNVVSRLYEAEKKKTGESPPLKGPTFYKDQGQGY